MSLTDEPGRQTVDVRLGDTNSRKTDRTEVLPYVLPPLFHFFIFVVSIPARLPTRLVELQVLPRRDVHPRAYPACAVSPAATLDEEERVVGLFDVSI